MEAFFHEVLKTCLPSVLEPNVLRVLTQWGEEAGKRCTSRHPPTCIVNRQNAYEWNSKCARMKKTKPEPFNEWHLTLTPRYFKVRKAKNDAKSV